MEFIEKKCAFCGERIVVSDDRVFCCTDCYLTHVEPIEDILYEGELIG